MWCFFFFHLNVINIHSLISGEDVSERPSDCFLSVPVQNRCRIDKYVGGADRLLLDVFKLIMIHL